VAEDSLQPLITQCPTCRTRFRVTDSQLNVAAGRVRCGACLSVFVGMEHLVPDTGPRLKPGQGANEALDAMLDELRKDPGPRPDRAQPAESKPRRDAPPRAAEADRAPTEVLAKRAVAAGSSTTRDAVQRRDSAIPVDSAADTTPPGVAIDAVAARRARRQKLASAEPESSSVSAPADDTVTEPEAESALATAVAQLDIRAEDLLPSPRRRQRRWWMPVALVLGVALLTGQVLYLQFDAWARNPDIRPVYEWLCSGLNCQLPVMRALDDIRSKNLVVRSNPDVPGELMVDALIVNQARFAQPFPVIELRFSSMDGRPITARRFTPEEYLAGELKGATMFAPLTPVHIALAIEDPGTDAVSYYIQFR
jgi:predicted Zn finger-like uncharacterized protein